MLECNQLAGWSCCKGESEGGAHLYGEITHSVFDTLNLRCLLDIQEEILSRQFMGKLQSGHTNLSH